MTRSLHLVDIENLIGPDRDPHTIRLAAARYAEIAEVGAADLVIVASAPRIGVQVKAAFPSASVRWRSGPDGADLALLDGLDELPLERFDRLVIGSGDGIFAAAVERGRCSGLAVRVISRRCARSRALALQPCEHRSFDLERAA